MGLLNKINMYLNEAKVGEEILKQIKALNKWALPSWGAKNFVLLKNDGVQFDVRGSKFKGRVLIYYDKGHDIYNIEFGKITKKLEWKQTNFIKQVFAGDLVNILDQHIG